MATPTPPAWNDLTASPAPAKPGGGAVWKPFVWAAIWLALFAGFGLGGMLFAAPALGLPSAAGWPRPRM